MLLEIYSDGSGNTFDSDGGYGWRLIVDGVFHSEGSGYLSSATNNVAELTAAIKGLEAATAYLNSSAVTSSLGHSVVLISDSQLVLGYANGAYKCKALHLSTLYIQLRQLYKAINATTRWVKGHSGDENNEKCDQLAKAARESKGSIGGSQPKISGI